jgi:hypothetical protein
MGRAISWGYTSGTDCLEIAEVDVDGEDDGESDEPGGGFPEDPSSGGSSPDDDEEEEEEEDEDEDPEFRLSSLESESDSDSFSARLASAPGSKAVTPCSARPSATSPRIDALCVAVRDRIPGYFVDLG